MGKYYNLVLQPTKKEDYLEEAIATARYIQTRRVDTEHGIYWSIKEGYKLKDPDRTFDEICWYSGSSGVVHFFVQLYEITKDESLIDDVKLAADYMVYRWYNKRKLGACFTQFAFTSGYSGVAHVLIEVAKITGDNKYSDAAINIIETAIAEAEPQPDGRTIGWGTFPGIVGDAGTILFILEGAEVFNKPEWKDFAAKAGKEYFKIAKEYEEGGIYYNGCDTTQYGTGEYFIDPNFPLGTAGIGYMFLRLFEETKDKEFLKDLDGILTFFDKAIYTEDGEAYLMPHALLAEDRKDLYYMGFCHGPAGTCRYFQKLYQVTGDEKAKTYEKKFAEGMIRAGVPEIQSPGYWNVYNFCCGTAGILNTFLGLYLVYDDEQYLRLARRCGRTLLGVSSHYVDEGGLKAYWNLALDRVAPEKVTTPIGMYDGVAGIGSALLQLYTFDNGDFHTPRSIDDPYPASTGA